MEEYSRFPVIINQNNLVTSDSRGSTFRYEFPRSIQLQNARLALSNISIYYSWFNITAENNNNTYSFIWTDGSGSTTYNVTIPDGFYDVSAINSFFQQFCISNGLYLVDGNGDFVYYIEFVTNSTYYSVQVNIYPFVTALPAGWSNPNSLTFPAVASTPQLIVPSTNFGNLIGFVPATYPAAIEATTQSFLSSFTPQVTPIQSLVISCSLLNNLFSNPSTILYSFGISDVSFGSLIESAPNEFNYIDVQSSSYNGFDITILDQNFNQITLQDPNLIIQLLFKIKKSDII